MTIQLTEAIISRAPFATDMAASMGKSALPELTTLAQHDNASVRIDVLRALAKIDITHSYALIFNSLDDDNVSVVHTSLDIIDCYKAKLSLQIVCGLLNRVQHPAAKARVILILGDVLSIDNASLLEQYCTIEQGESVALHAVVALAKIGIDNRRQQFAAYLLSIKNNPALFRTLFVFIDYINQTWLLPPLRQLLSNKTHFQTLNARLPNSPKDIRVCDRALMCIAAISHQELSFKTDVFARYDDAQLGEAAHVCDQFQH